ncbi:hypothetical protein N7456_007846 [Penicillium angulare]|uniref:Uncharacterized protein n=1 Tax=Penicillium angulare TaxID=116970 RepID=A0A9W9K8S6_9EURO|nr:hypothetical protein N7456_007846 [Penicillium angulare]
MVNSTLTLPNEHVSCSSIDAARQLFRQLAPMFATQENLPTTAKSEDLEFLALSGINIEETLSAIKTLIPTLTPNRPIFASFHDGQVHNSLGGGSSAFHTDAIAPILRALIIDEELAKDRMGSHHEEGNWSIHLGESSRLPSRSIIVHAGAQPSDPHVGTLVVFCYAFALARKIRHRMQAAAGKTVLDPSRVSVQITLIDTASAKEQKTEIGGIQYQRSHRDTPGMLDTHMGDCKQIISLLSKWTGIPVNIDSQWDFFSNPAIPSILRYIVDNRSLLGHQLSPKYGTHIQTIRFGQHVKDLKYLDSFISEMGRAHIPWQDLALDDGISIREFRQRYNDIRSLITGREVPTNNHIPFSDHVDMVETSLKIIAKLEGQQGVRTLYLASPYKLGLRAACPHPGCWITEKYGRLKMYTRSGLNDEKDALFSTVEDAITFQCPYHGPHTICISKPAEVVRLEANTPTRNLIRSMCQLMDTEKHHVRVTGADYAGVYQEMFLYRPLAIWSAATGLAIGRTPHIMYAPLIVDWSGAKLSKSSYVRDGGYETMRMFGTEGLWSFACLNRQFDGDEEEGLRRVWEEVKMWLEDPKKLFRTFSVEYLQRVIMQGQEWM